MGYGGELFEAPILPGNPKLMIARTLKWGYSAKPIGFGRYRAVASFGAAPWVRSAPAPRVRSARRRRFVRRRGFDRRGAVASIGAGAVASFGGGAPGSLGGGAPGSLGGGAPGPGGRASPRGRETPE